MPEGHSSAMRPEVPAKPATRLGSNISNLLLVLLLSVLAVFFSLGNRQQVELHFLSFNSSPMPLYIPVFVAFAVGFVGGVIALSFSRHKHKREIARLRRENACLQQELDNLRTMPLQDDL